MEDNEIIKALERCGQHRECCYCNSVEECGNKRILTKATLDLINRLQAENEQKDKNFIELLKTSGERAVIISELQAENERLKDCIDEQDIEISRLYKRIDEAKTEAYKEFAQRLKERASRGFWETDDYIGAEQIDDLVKDLVEDKP